MVGFSSLIDGALLVFQPFVLFLMVAGLLIGISMGSIPGMTATMTVAVLVSFTFGMQPIEGMILLLGIYGGALYAGSIPAILIRTPGTPSAAATVFDGFPMAQQGKAGQAISIATIASVIGGTISVIFLTLLSPQVAEIALEFRSPAYFALAFFGLTIIANVSGDSLVKGLIAGLIGMFLATVGLDPIIGAPRFTFDTTVLTGGIDFIAVMIGLFGIAEALIRYSGGIDRENFDQSVARIMPTFNNIKKITPTAILSSIAGVLIGAIPGAGGDIASFVTYNEAKRWAGDVTPSFGEGNPLGVAAAEAGNNSSTGGALIPTLTLGIPGDSVTAILIGALLVHGIRPGPSLLEDEPELVYAIFVGFFMIYILILVFGLLGAHFWVRLIDFPAKYLWPAILVLCVVGSLAVRGNMIDVWVMLGGGIFGMILRKNDYPLAPIVLGMILGPIAESNLRRSLAVSNGSIDIFFESSITVVILLLTAITLLLPFLQTRIIGGRE